MLLQQKWGAATYCARARVPFFCSMCRQPPLSLLSLLLPAATLHHQRCADSITATDMLFYFCCNKWRRGGPLEQVTHAVKIQLISVVGSLKNTSPACEGLAATGSGGGEAKLPMACDVASLCRGGLTCCCSSSPPDLHTARDAAHARNPSGMRKLYVLRSDELRPRVRLEYSASPQKPARAHTSACMYDSSVIVRP